MYNITKTDLLTSLTEIVSYVDRILEHKEYTEYAAGRLLRHVSPEGVNASEVPFLAPFNTEEFRNAIQKIALPICKREPYAVVRQALADAFAVAVGTDTTNYRTLPLDLNDILSRLNTIAVPNQHLPAVQAKAIHLRRLMTVLGFLSPVFPANTIKALLSGDTWDNEAIREVIISMTPHIETPDWDLSELPEHLRIHNTARDNGDVMAIIPSGWLGGLDEAHYRTILEGLVENASDYLACGDMEHTLKHIEISEGDALGFTIGGGNNADSIVATMICNVTRGRVMV